jgi:hypothetical protein
VPQSPIICSRVPGFTVKAPDENVAVYVQEIKSLWDKGDLQPQDFATLAKRFEEILRAYDFTS